MTYAIREEIFSKDYITINDIMILLGLSYGEAAKMIRSIKKALTVAPKYNGQGVRLNVQGKLHVQDYLDYFNITDHKRYSAPDKSVEACE